MALDVETAEAEWVAHRNDDDFVTRMEVGADLIEAYLHAADFGKAFAFAQVLESDCADRVPTAENNAAFAAADAWIATAHLTLAMLRGNRAGLQRAHRAYARAYDARLHLRQRAEQLRVTPAGLNIADAAYALTLIAIAADAEEASTALAHFWHRDTSEHPIFIYLSIEALLRARQYDLARATAQDNRGLLAHIWPDPEHPIRVRCARIADDLDFASGANGKLLRDSERRLEHAYDRWQDALSGWIDPVSGESISASLAAPLATLREAVQDLEYILGAPDRELTALEAAPQAGEAASPGTGPLTAAKRTMSVREQLDALTGLDGVKSHIERLEQNLRAQQLRRDKGLEPFDVGAHHLVFTGNPGTGKTTVARLIGQLYKEAGLLDIGHVVEVNRSGLVGRYIGHTESKTVEVLESALGGVLFIDEAYALHPGDSSRDFGARVIDEIVKYASDHDGQLVIILAGYPKEMHGLLETNPGLRSRFSRVFEFADLSTDELLTVFRDAAVHHDYVVTDGAEAAMRDLLDRIPHDRNFGNARTVLDLFTQSVERHGARVATLVDPDIEVLVELTAHDIPPINEVVVGPPAVTAKGQAAERTGMYL